MAEIPVHKKGGIPWWVWLLLALLVIGLLWLLFANNDDEAVPVAAPVETAQTVDAVPAATTDGPITDLATLTSGPMTALVGREVMLTGVPVESLEGDQGFYIGDSATSRALVVFNEQPTPNTPQEGNVDVNADSTVAIRGTVRDGSATPPPGTTTPLPTGPYIEASSVDVVS